MEGVSIMDICQRNGCKERSTRVVETWVGSVPIWYNVCDEHIKEIEKECL